MVNFSEKQLQAIELLARAEYEGLTQQQVADAVDISARTIRRWLQDKKFKDAVGRKSLEAITELSPMVYKATADFLLSKDNKIRAKGVDTFLKAKEKLEAIERQETEKKPVFDVDAWLKELCPILEDVPKSRRRNFLNGEINKHKENIKRAVEDVLNDEYRLQLVKENKEIEEIKYLSSQYKYSAEDVARILNEVFADAGVTVIVVEGEK